MSKKRLSIFMAVTFLVVTLLAPIVKPIKAFADINTSDIENIAKSITKIPEISKGQQKIVFPDVPEGYRISLYGSDRKPVIDMEGNIHAPLVNSKVNLIFQLENESNPEEKAITNNISAVVPGQYVQSDDVNKEPKVIPSLREWYGEKGSFALSKTSKIVVNPKFVDKLQSAAEVTKQDIKDINGYDLEVAYGVANNGDIYLTLDDSLGYMGKEGYILNVKDYVEIKAPETKGVFYGTRTVLQILKQTEGQNNIPKGISRDYPKYENRALMLDVGRKFYTIDFLRDYVKLMSWYKMSDFQIHLNDANSSIYYKEGKEVYSAFRLESERYPGLASKDGHYTKKEFRDLQSLGMAYGVNVIPEIDTPAHSNAFTKYDPSLGEGFRLDLKKPEVWTFVKNLFDEYLDGDNPTFIAPNVHIGTDEYETTTTEDIELFRKYIDELLNYMISKGKHPWFWGGLGKYQGNTPVTNKATMNLWYTPYADPQKMVDLGYDLVNTHNYPLYIVPAAGYFEDYLNTSLLYNSWEPNIIDKTVFPLGHPKIKGGMFALWNDIIGNGISMHDTHDRLLPGMQVLSEKMWTGTREDKDYEKFLKAAENIGEAPNANISHKLKVNNPEGKVLDFNFEGNLNDNSGNGFNAQGKNSTLVPGRFGQALRLNGGESYIKTPLRSLGFGWTVSMWIKPDRDNAENAVILESPEGILKLKQGNTNKLGFSKENYNHYFKYEVPSDKWTHILLTGDNKGTSLYVNGDEYFERLESSNVPRYVETFILPVEKIGSSTNSFKGEIDNLKIYNRFINVLNKNNNVALGKPAESSELEVPYLGPDKALDGIENFSSRWSAARDDNAWFLVDLEEEKDINKIVIKWAPSYAEKYKLLVSNDKVNWTSIISENDGIIEGKGGTDSFNLENVNARYVKFQGVKRTVVEGEPYGYSFYEFEVYEKEANMKEYNSLIQEAESLLSTGKGDEILRQEIKAIIEGYPLNYAVALNRLKVLVKELRESTNKERLEEIIKLAKEMYNSAVIGIKEGEYSKEDKEVLAKSIEQAEAIYNRLPLAAEEVEKAIEDLSKAVEDFKSKAVRVNRGALGFTIEEAKDILSKATVGNKEGQYPQKAVTTLEKAIKRAEDIFKTEQVFQKKVDMALKNLNDAIDEFKSKIITK